MDSTRRKSCTENDDGGREFSATVKKEKSGCDERLRVRLRSRKLKKTAGIQIYLTVESDPAFYYSVDITDDDYRELKNRQGLLVDLPAFPAMIYRLLDACICEEEKSRDSDSIAKFTAVLAETDVRGDEITFEVQETNSFRRLAHLSLKFRKGNDARLSEHLADCLKSLKAEHKLVRDQLKEVQDVLMVSNEEKSALMKDLAELKHDNECKEVAYQNKLAREVTEERDRLSKVVADLRANHENERKQAAEETAATIRTLENRVAALDYDNRDLTERKHKNEALVSRLKEEVKHTTSELKATRAELELRKAENDKIGHGNHELDLSLNRLQARVDMLEQDKLQLGDTLRSRDEALKDAQEQRRRLEAEVDEKRVLVAKRENAVRNVSQELMKANEVIRKLQDQNRKQDQKIKLGCQIVQEQEKVVTDKDAELEEARTELKEKCEELSALHKESDEAERLLGEARDKASELEKKVKTNEAVIQWLNKQLTTAQSRDPGLRLGPPPDGLNFTPSAMASTSTPVVARPTKAGIDPKYLVPSPRQRLQNSSGGAGLLRKDMSASKSPANTVQSPNSVYFAK